MDEPFEMPPSFDPDDIVCSRGRLGSQTYDAELRIYGIQYVLSTGHKTHEEAKAAARAKKEALKGQLLDVVKVFVQGMSPAKP